MLEIYIKHFDLIPIIALREGLGIAIVAMDLLFSHSHVQLFVTPWTAACQASLSFTISQSLLKLMSIWCYPTISTSASPSPPAFNLPQHQGLFQ